MTTRATRGRMAKIERKTTRYPTDLTDEEWSRIEPLLPACGKTGRSRSVDLRDILDAIRCMARSGGGWRMLPKDFPPWQTVHRWFRCFVRRLLFRTIHDVALMIDRERSGRKASASAGIVRRSDHEPGFKVLPHRWIVERTFGWMTRWLRLVSDYEARRRRLRGYDPRCYGQPLAQAHRPLSIFKR